MNFQYPEIFKPIIIYMYSIIVNDGLWVASLVCEAALPLIKLIYIIIYKNSIKILIGKFHLYKKNFDLKKFGP